MGRQLLLPTENRIKQCLPSGEPHEKKDTCVPSNPQTLWTYASAHVSVSDLDLEIEERSEPMTEPTESEIEEFWLRLHAIIARGLHRVVALYGAETALAMAQQFDDGQWQLMTEIDLDGDEKPIPGSLAFRVDVWVPALGEFAEFLAVKAPVLGVSPELEAEEAALTALQHGIGFEIPDDLSGLDDP
jgi:hypothetical protein